MGLPEIKEKLEDIHATLLGLISDHAGGRSHMAAFTEGVYRACGRIYSIARALDQEAEADDDPDLPAGPGFVVLPIEAHDRLREMAERAEEAEAKLTACEQSLLVQLDEKGVLDMRLRDARATIDRLKAGPPAPPPHTIGPPRGLEQWSEVGPEERKRAAVEWRRQCEIETLLTRRPDPARFPIRPEPGREGDRIEPSTPGPMHVTPRTTPDPVVHQHLRDLQGEVDGLKDRLEEICREHQGMNARLAALEDVGGFPVGGEFAAFKARLDEQSDRLHAFGARMNKAEAQVKPRPVETAATPFTNSPA